MLLGDILELNAVKWPDRVALTFGELTYTFEELRQRSRRLAVALQSLTGTAAGDRIAVLSENTVEYIDAYYGVPSAGMALVPLNYRLNPHELAWIIQDAQASVLIVQRAYLPAILAVRDLFPCVRHLVVTGGLPDDVDVLDFDALVNAADPANLGKTPDEDDVAWQLYTSGTTGNPKGAMLTHRSLVVAIINSVVANAVHSDERTLFCFPLCHVAGYLVTISHMVGAPVVMMQTFAPGPWIELVDRHRITSAGLAPTMVNFVLQHPTIDDHDLSSLESIGYGAAAMPVELLRATINRFGPIVWSTFGMTELSGSVLTHPRSVHVRAANGEEHLLASCGRPQMLAAVKVVDPEMNELGPTEVGEIVVRGEQVLQGYWNLPQATEEAFRGGWFHTGDMAYRDEEGFFYIVDRLKDMIITGGENVYSRQVEEVLYLHPGVSEAAIIGVPDPVWGERVVAVIAMKAGVEPVADEILSVCRGRLAGFKTPREVHFVDELPKNVSGKILKRELRDRFSGLSSKSV